MNLNDIALLNIKGAKYCRITSGILKNEAIRLDAKCLFDGEKGEHYKTFSYFQILSYTKMNQEILTFGSIKIEKKKFYRYKYPTLFKKCRLLKRISI